MVVDLSEREKRFAETSIYPVITPELCRGRSPLSILEAALRGGAKIAQLRAKERPERYAAGFREITDQYAALLVINDSLDLALKYNADGVHLGQADLPVSEARKLAPELLIGASTQQIRIISYGEERPAADGHDEGAWSLNRRVEIIYRTR